MNAVRQFLGRIRTTGVRRAGVVKTVSMGRARAFHAWDVGEDTFIIEDGVGAHLGERPSVLIVEKGDLRGRAHGRVMTITTGNHAVAAFPLLDGRFWRLSTVPAARRSDVLMHRILCANVVEGTVETSQRDLPAARLYAADRWLLERVGFSMGDVVMGDRNETVLSHYRMLGQEWRVKPLAWTEREMRVALAAARKRIGSCLSYYHSARGVHFLTCAEFGRLAALARTDPAAFVAGLRELVSVFEGNDVSFVRMPKYRGHHEIEFFGVRRGVAIVQLVPALESLMEAIVLGRLGQLGIIQRAGEIAALFVSLLSQAELADESSKTFVETLYMYVTGEIYSVVGEGSTPAFDDRRTALPGATFVGGRPVMQPGSDARSEVLFSNLRSFMSKDEVVEYANVYELREDTGMPIGRGFTREVVFKTNRRPLEDSVIEKRLSHPGKDYGSYMLARIGVLRALGIRMSAYYRLLRRRATAGHAGLDYYIRRRCEGEPMESIPRSYFRSTEDAAIEDRDVVLGLAQLMGDAAAQNMAMKKYDPKTESPLFGVGKEIYEFEYDILRQRVVPKSVATCSIRGSFGWPNLAQDEANLAAMGGFYLGSYAHALKVYCRLHAVPMDALAARFMDGFEFRTHALAWQLSVMRDRFETFTTPLPRHYAFDAKWRFLMWSLERQERRLPLLRKRFFEKVELIEHEDIRNHPQ